MIRFPPGLEPAQDLAPAAWVREALKDWPGAGKFLVRDLVPPVFEAYARVLHRPRKPGDIRVPTGSWADRAAELGRPLDSQTRWHDLEMPENDPWRLEQGSVSEPELEFLTHVLEAFTSDVGVWFGIWSGFLLPHTGVLYLSQEGPFAEWRARRRADLQARRESKAAARWPSFELRRGSGTRYLLVGGTVADAARFHAELRFSSPSLWWPDDRAWFVHTHFEATSTYVGGSLELIGDLQGRRPLESFEVQADTPVAW